MRMFVQVIHQESAPGRAGKGVGRGREREEARQRCVLDKGSLHLLLQGTLGHRASQSCPHQGKGTGPSYSRRARQPLWCRQGVCRHLGNIGNKHTEALGAQEGLCRDYERMCGDPGRALPAPPQGTRWLPTGLRSYNWPARFTDKAAGDRAFCPSDL